jgi:hypothetical protein
MVIKRIEVFDDEAAPDRVRRPSTKRACGLWAAAVKVGHAVTVGVRRLVSHR